MIPLAIAIGIIEDKIANDLTGNKSTKEHLEDVKEKLLAHKPKLFVEIELKKSIWGEDDDGHLRVISKLQFGEISHIEETNNFIILHNGLEQEYIELSNIERISVKVVEE